MKNSVFIFVPLLWYFMISASVSSQEAVIIEPDDIPETSPQISKQSLLFLNKFRHLNVPKLEEIMVYDDFECTFKCLHHPLCVSVNLAAEGQLWCELLSTDKHSNPNEYKENKNWHHFSFENACADNPCENNGTCQSGFTDKIYRCLCTTGFEGPNCEKVSASTCKEIFDRNVLKKSGEVTLHLDSKRISVFCHMGDFGCGEGGWTPVMKINGIKSTFHYDSHFWSDRNSYNLIGGKSGFDSQETKLPTYWKMPFSKICLGMKIGNQYRFIDINKQAVSLHSLIADGKYRNTSLGRLTWKSLIPSEGSLQPHCNKEGINTVGDKANISEPKARIGIIANEQSNCVSCNSRIGFGTGGSPDDSNTCGNEAISLSDKGDKHIKAMGYILVQ